jgi:hypothetical protein
MTIEKLEMVMDLEAKAQIRVHHVTSDHVGDVWPLVSDFIQAALDQQTGEPEFSLTHVKQYVLNGQWYLYTINAPEKIIGAVTVLFFERPDHRVAFVPYMGGKWLSDKNVFAQFCSLLKDLGVTHLEGGVNAISARLWRRFGFVQKYQIIGVKL